MRDQLVYCRDILERIQRIESYTVDGRIAFMESSLIQDGVIRSFEIIGEAVKQLTPEVMALQPTIMWSDFAGFRDVLIHRYHRIRLDLVWQFIEEDVPLLKAGIEAIIQMLQTQSTNSSDT
ncbi:MAG: DUF86 domain-containing protein [Anaerolineae bacterium]|nr:DUF86 domain-containing protein [Anaerolineae bacterium]